MRFSNNNVKRVVQFFRMFLKKKGIGGHCAHADYQCSRTACRCARQLERSYRPAARRSPTGSCTHADHRCAAQYLAESDPTLHHVRRQMNKQFLAIKAYALQNHAIQRKLFSAQRSVTLRIVSAYRTISTSAVLVLASIPPIDLLAKERQETFQLRKELTCTDLQEIARAKEAIRKDGRHRLDADGSPGERMMEESYRTLSWNQPPAKFKGVTHLPA